MASETAPKLRILIIDDEPLTLKALRRMLRDYDVTLAPSGAEGLSLHADHGPYDVILCDVMMPGLTGVDVYRRLKESSPGQEERIVFISGGVFGLDVVEFLESVPNLLLEKPFDCELLLSVLTNVAAQA